MVNLLIANQRSGRDATYRVSTDTHTGRRLPDAASHCFIEIDVADNLAQPVVYFAQLSG